MAGGPVNPHVLDKYLSSNKTPVAYPSNTSGSGSWGPITSTGGTSSGSWGSAPVAPSAPAVNSTTSGGGFGMPGFDMAGIAALIGGSGILNGSGGSADPGIPQYTYNGPSAEDMATKEYAPQFEALQKIIEATQGRYDVASKNTTDMYNALANETRGRTAGIQKDYATTGGQIKNAYNTANDNTVSGVEKTIGNISNMLANLGQDQAGSEVMSRVGTHLADWLGAINATGANQQGLNTGLGASAATYNNQTADTQGLAGKNAVADLTLQLQAIQADNEQKRLGIMGNEASAENSYGMNIQKLMQTGQQQSNDMYIAQQKNQIDQSAADLGLKKLEAQIAQSNTDNNLNQDKLGLEGQRVLNLSHNPGAILTANAATMWQGDTQGAATAVNNVLTAYSKYGSGQNTNYGTMMQHYKEDYPNTSELDYQRVSNLMLNLISQVGNKNDPVYQGG